jgi:hypothetical protein
MFDLRLAHFHGGFQVGFDPESHHLPVVGFCINQQLCDSINSFQKTAL